jgi:menaquinol-cytochrome c reductase iron-sulfur subunit
MMAAVVGLPVIQYFISPALKKDVSDDWISLGPLENYPLDIPTPFHFTLTRVNGWERSSQSYGAFVLRGPSEEIVIFSDACTHLSCRVSWDPENEEFLCPCHAASFDKFGRVTSGPPPKPLNRYEIKLEENQLFIHFREG